jgi:hypothetical protein
MAISNNRKPIKNIRMLIENTVKLIVFEGLPIVILVGRIGFKRIAVVIYEMLAGNRLMRIVNRRM